MVIIPGAINTLESRGSLHGKIVNVIIVAWLGSGPTPWQQHHLERKLLVSSIPRKILNLLPGHRNEDC